MSQKYLDSNGVQYFWLKIADDYPNNEILIAIINAIDSDKVSKVELDKYLLIEDYVADITGGFDTSILLKSVYPVGSIYMSATNVNPATLFGFGTWEPIKDRFLLAAGDTYEAGSIGGEAEHTLTELEMPAHDHEFDRHQLWRNESIPSSTTTVEGYGANNKTLPIYTDTTVATGAGESHNNMPPYLTVYIWKRTA